MPTEHEWRNLAEDAVNDLFKLYVGDQVLMVIRNQLAVGQFTANITAARDKRADVMEAIEGIT